MPALSYKTVPFGTKRQVGGAGLGWKWRNKTLWGGGGSGRENIPGTNWILTLTSTQGRERVPFFWVSEIGFGWLGQWWRGRLVDPFLMCNDGFMPRISPLEDFRRLWKGSKWPIGIQIRAKGGESRFIFFLVERTISQNFHLPSVLPPAEKVESCWWNRNST